MPPLVSIIIPCYNAGRWLDETIESALAQTWGHTEIIAVDDGSTDDTFRRLQSFGSRGIRAFQQANRGASAARNRALADARGDFIQFLDADDLLSSNKIAAQIDTLSERGGGKVAACAWSRFVTSPAEAVFTPESVWRDQTAVDFFVTGALEGLWFPNCAWLMPRRLCEEAGPWDETLSMNDDGEYMSRVLAASDGIVFCDDARAYYRSGDPMSVSRRQTRAAADSDLRAWDKMVSRILDRERSDRTRRAAATGYQYLQVRYYGLFPDIIAEAERKERSFGGGSYRFYGGPIFSMTSRLFGWKAAMRLLNGRIGR